jgi:UDP-2,3-diacylglucosamine hydrolase
MDLYLVSDVHLYPEPEEHPGREMFLRFLSMLGDRSPGSLWIAGDLFDYWFEYRSVIPSGFERTLAALRRLSGSGWQLDFLPGNHDWWTGRHFVESTGATVHRDRWVELQAHGMNMTIAHGDGLGPGDTGYRLLRPVLRSKVSTGLFSLLHPTLGTAFARLFSGTSRRILRQQACETPSGLLQWVDERLEQGADLVATGHTHLASLDERAGGIHLSLGDWISRFTYSVVSGEGVELLQFGVDGESSPV